MIMQLNDRLVLKHFGMRPDLGKRMLIRTQVSTGNTCYNTVFGKEKHQPYQTHIRVALRHTGKPGMWEVLVAPQFKERVELWLIDNCQLPRLK